MREGERPRGARRRLRHALDARLELVRVDGRLRALYRGVAVARAREKLRALAEQRPARAPRVRRPGESPVVGVAEGRCRGGVERRQLELKGVDGGY